jgi:hypothetical protein
VRWLVFLYIFCAGCSVTCYSTPDKGLIHVRIGDSKLKGVEAVVDGSEIKVDSSESEGKLEVPIGSILGGL